MFSFNFPFTDFNWLPRQANSEDLDQHALHSHMRLSEDSNPRPGGEHSWKSTNQKVLTKFSLALLRERILKELDGRHCPASKKKTKENQNQEIILVHI